MTDLDKEFLNLYQSFENWARDSYASDSDVILEDIYELSKYRQKLGGLRKLRNLLAHNGGYVSATPEALEELRNIALPLMSPPTAKELGIAVSQIHAAKENDSLDVLLQDMVANDYTHIPILKDNKVVGLLSEDTILRAIAAGEKVLPIEQVTLDALSEYVTLDNVSDGRYCFIGEDQLLPFIFEKFQNAKDVNHRLDIMFVTKHGLPTEPLRRIITVWDVAGYDR